ncbi:MAG: VC1465 family Xer recombination activation factor, partial [Thermomonas sp.]
MLSVESCADLLQVSERTIRNWESASARVPYAAYRLMRVMRAGKVLGPDWAGFHVWRGVLCTPEGHRFEPSDLVWQSLLVQQARAFREFMRERRTAENSAFSSAPGVARRGLV